jgi:hypothetical protein
LEFSGRRLRKYIRCRFPLEITGYRRREQMSWFRRGMMGKGINVMVRERNDGEGEKGINVMVRGRNDGLRVK